jgi:hypothetical protein
MYVLQWLVGTAVLKFPLQCGEEFIDYASIALRVNGVLEQDGPNNLKHRTPHSKVDGVKASFTGCMGIFTLL